MVNQPFSTDSVNLGANMKFCPNSYFWRFRNSQPTDSVNLDANMTGELCPDYFWRFSTSLPTTSVNLGNSMTVWLVIAQ